MTLVAWASARCCRGVGPRHIHGPNRGRGHRPGDCACRGLGTRSRVARCLGGGRQDCLPRGSGWRMILAGAFVLQCRLWSRNRPSCQCLSCPWHPSCPAHGAPETASLGNQIGRDQVMRHSRSWFCSECRMRTTGRGQWRGWWCLLCTKNTVTVAVIVSCCAAVLCCAVLCRELVGARETRFRGRIRREACWGILIQVLALGSSMSCWSLPGRRG